MNHILNRPASELALKWVKLKKYCELSGDTQNAVRNRRKRGIWLDKKQSKLAPDGTLWVNLLEVEKWVEHT
jgi:hypothetical protein